jgi:hypothetical protein
MRRRPSKKHRFDQVAQLSNGNRLAHCAHEDETIGLAEPSRGLEKIMLGRTAPLNSIVLDRYVADIDSGMSFEAAFERMGQRFGMNEGYDLAHLIKQSLLQGGEIVASLESFGAELADKRIAIAREQIGRKRDTFSRALRGRPVCSTQKKAPDVGDARRSTPNGFKVRSRWGLFEPGRVLFTVHPAERECQIIRFLRVSSLICVTATSTDAKTMFQEFVDVRRILLNCVGAPRVPGIPDV